MLILAIIHALILLIFLTFLIYVVHFRKTDFDLFQYLTMSLYIVLLCSQTGEAVVSMLVIDDFNDPRVQIFETLHTSLFFLFVDSIWYRMKSLHEGDKFFTTVLIKEARKKILGEFFAFMIGYGIITAIITLIDFEATSFNKPDKYFDTFHICVYLLELFKLFID
jgi:hypothetical protein